MDEMLPRLLDETLTVLGTDTGAIYLFDEQENVLKAVVAKGWFLDIFEETVSLSAGIEGKTFSTGTPYLSAELALDPLTNETTRSKIPSGWGGMCIPIRSADEILGVLWVAMVQPRQLQPENLHLLITLSEIAGNAFHRTRLHAQTEQRLRRLTALRTLDMAISVNVDLNKTINILLDQAITHLGVDAADVLLFNPDLNSLEYVAGRGFRSDSFASTSLQLGQGLAGRAVLERKIVKFQDWREEPGLGDLPSLTASFETENFISYYGLPLIVKEQVKGVLEVFHRSPLKADPEWLDFLATLAGQVAMAIDDAQLFSSLQRSNSELAQAYTTTLEGWSRALDLKDKETEGHTQRVAAMTIQLAQILGISEAEIVHIRRGALLHDIGKMGIPDDILLKPGALSEEEWLIMRKHPTYAYEMLAPIEYLRLSLDIPYCHHEKWDGTGYPQGLKAENIPLAARLFAVVDVWDALISDRPYRSAWSREKALAYIAAQSGKYFDPRVVEAFLKIP
jgi:GAF domain-containing protein